MNYCQHKRDTGRWEQVFDEYEGVYYNEFVESTEYTYVDIGVGAFKCTQCNEVGYYTGLWKNFYENDVPCTASEFVGATELSNVKKAIKESK